MELPDPYLPGAISLLDQLDKRLVVLLRDGRTLIGCLRTIDQFANLILDEVVERTSVDKFYHDINHGILLIRGENVVLAGEIDPNINTGMQEVSSETIQQLERERAEKRAKFEEARSRAMKGRGKMAPSSSSYRENLDDNF